MSPTTVSGTPYTGYFPCGCHHPLSLLDQYGDLEHALPPRGNHPGAGFWGRFLGPMLIGTVGGGGLDNFVTVVKLVDQNGPLRG